MIPSVFNVRFTKLFAELKSGIVADYALACFSMVNQTLRNWLLLLVTYSLVICPSCKSTDPALPVGYAPIQQNKLPVSLNPIFHPGDSLELYVEEDSTFNGVYPVRPGGYVLIPKIGRIAVDGLNRDSAENLIARTLENGQLKSAKVIVEHISSGIDRPGAPGVLKVMVFITGSVARSGAHYIPLTNGRLPGVYETLLIAGGVSKFAQIGKVEVYRTSASGKRERGVVDLRAIRDGKAEDPPVSEGDIINVAEKVFGF